MYCSIHSRSAGSGWNTLRRSERVQTLIKKVYSLQALGSRRGTRTEEDGALPHSLVAGPLSLPDTSCQFLFLKFHGTDLGSSKGWKEQADSA